MKWVTINKGHFNTDRIKAFYWSAGKLYIYWVDEEDYETFQDPAQKNYKRLCLVTGVKPLEVDNHGKN